MGWVRDTSGRLAMQPIGSAFPHHFMEGSLAARDGEDTMDVNVLAVAATFVVMAAVVVKRSVEDRRAPAHPPERGP